MISQFCPTLSKDLLKREFLNTAAAFAVLAVLGFAAGMLFPDAAQQLLDRFAAQLEQLGLSSNVPQSQMMATLFFNNVTASLLAMLYGLIPFVPLSALALGTNALLLGALPPSISTTGSVSAFTLSGSCRMASLSCPR